MITDVKNNENICVVSLCKSVGMDIRDRLKKEFPDIDSLIVCLHSESDVQLKEELHNIEHNWKKYRVLIFTPIVGAGLDFVPEHFNRVYGYVCGGNESPRSYLQMIGRIRHLKDINVTTLIASNMNKKTNAQLYSLDYAEKYHKSIVHKDYTDCMQYVYKDENNQTTVVKEAKSNLWNRMRAYHIQEKELNNTSDNFLSMLKIQIEQKGHIFETDFNIDKVKKMEIKKDIERILEVPTISNNECNELKTKDNLNEIEQYMIKKVQLRRELNLKDKIKDEELNECLLLYDQKRDEINNVLKYYNEAEIIDDDSYEEKKTDNINSAFTKVLDCLDCEFIDVKKFDNDDFENRINSIEFTKGEINSLKSRGKLKQKYDMVKVVLSRFGIQLKVCFERKRISGKQVKIKSGYELNYCGDIFDIIKCKIHGCEHKPEHKSEHKSEHKTEHKRERECKYDPNFVTFVKRYKKYDSLLSNKYKKIFEKTNNDTL